MELARIEDGAPVDPIYTSIRQKVTTAQEEHDEDLDQLAREAVARATKARSKTGKRSPRPVPVPAEGEEPARYPVRAFVLTWSELAGWWTHYDAGQLAVELSDEQITTFLTTVEGTSMFADQLRAALQHPQDDTATPGRLRAL